MDSASRDPSEHPSEEILKRFATGTASREESRAVVAHLVKGCSPCASKLRKLIEPAAVTGASYEKTLDSFDQDLVAGLESSVDPLETVREVLKRVPRQRLLEERKPEKE